MAFDKGLHCLHSPIIFSELTNCCDIQQDFGASVGKLLGSCSMNRCMDCSRPSLAKIMIITPDIALFQLKSIDIFPISHENIVGTH